MDGNASDQTKALKFGPIVHLLGEMACNFAEKSAESQKHKALKEELKRTPVFITSSDQMRPYAKKLYDNVREFVQEEIIPVEQKLIAHEAGPDRWTQSEEMENLKGWDHFEKCFDYFFIYFSNTN